MNRLRHTKHLAKNFDSQKLSKGTKEDIELFKDLVAIMSTNGTSIHNVTHSLPNVFWSDACEFGFGGFNNKGKAWQWQIPPKLRGLSFNHPLRIH